MTIQRAFRGDPSLDRRESRGALPLVRTETREALSNKFANARFAPGERFVAETSGGGGLGDPAERPVSEVEADLAAGRILSKPGPIRSVDSR